MSVKISMKTPQLKTMAAILHGIADDIAVSANDTITIDLELKYNEKKKGCNK